MATVSGIKCDCCGKQHDLNQGQPPKPWLEIHMVGPIPQGQVWPKHACCFKCAEGVLKKRGK